MFQKPSAEKTGLENTIDNLITQMSNEEGHTESYSAMVRNLETLYKLKAEDKPDRVKLDTIAVVAGNLLGVLIIVGFEKSHVMTSKALTTLLKPKS